MAYATEQNLIDRFGTAEVTQISDIENSGAINHTRITNTLADASARIDGFLAARYPLPIAQPPAMLREICCDMTRYLLTTRPTEEMRNRHEDALGWLEKVAKGTFSLGLDAANAQTPDTGGPASATTGRVFDADSLEEFNRFDRSPFP